MPTDVQLDLPVDEARGARVPGVAGVAGVPGVAAVGMGPLVVGLAPAAAHVRDASPNRAACVPILFRFAAYTGMLLATLALLLRLIMWQDGLEQRLFDEGGPVECAQFALIGTVVALLGVTAWRWPRAGVVLWPCAAIAAVAAVRELDSTLDDWFPLGGWQLFAAALVAAAAALVYRRRRHFWSHLLGWLHTPAAGLIWAGAVVVLIFAQLIGQADLWHSVMGDAYERGFKRTVEESAELFGYALILLGTIEAAFHAPALHRTSKTR